MGKIVWLASFPKSGNTWIRTLLANLFSHSEHPFDINALDQFCWSLTSRAPYDALAGKPSLDMPEHEILKLRGEIQRRFCEGSPDNAFLKTHSRFGSQYGLPLIDPTLTAGAIYIVRNPLDVLVSAASHFGVSVDAMARSMADPDFRIVSERHVTEYIGSWSANVASWTMPSHPSIHVIRYEDLYANPEDEFARIVSFLGLKPTEERMSRALRFSQFASMAEQERSGGFKERPAHAPAFFRRGRPDEGRESLPPSLIDAIVSAHRVQMKRFGYASA